MFQFSKEEPSKYGELFTKYADPINAYVCLRPVPYEVAGKEARCQVRGNVVIDYPSSACVKHCSYGSCVRLANSLIF